MSPMSPSKDFIFLINLEIYINNNISSPELSFKIRITNKKSKRVKLKSSFRYTSSDRN